VEGSLVVAGSSLGYTIAPIYGITKVPFEMSGRITVVNPTDSDVLVSVSVLNESAAGVQAAYQLVPRPVPAGGSDFLPIMVRRTRLIERGDQVLVFKLTSVPAQ
jgi:hypothetical protein